MLSSPLITSRGFKVPVSTGRHRNDIHTSCTHGERFSRRLGVSEMVVSPLAGKEGPSMLVLGFRSGSPVKSYASAAWLEPCRLRTLRLTGRKGGANFNRICACLGREGILSLQLRYLPATNTVITKYVIPTANAGQSTVVGFMFFQHPLYWSPQYARLKCESERTLYPREYTKDEESWFTRC